MADLMTVLANEDIVPRKFLTNFTGPINKAKIVTATAAAQPFARNTSFVVQIPTKAWFVMYDQTADEYWTVDLAKAT